MKNAVSIDKELFNEYEMSSTSLDFTNDDSLSPERHNALFKESIRFASDFRESLNNWLYNSTDEPSIFESSSSFLNECVQVSNVAAVFKLADEWNKQLEASFLGSSGSCVHRG